LLGLLFDPEDRGSTFLRIVSEILQDYTALLAEDRYANLRPIVGGNMIATSVQEE
jgi:hypothetical protein